MSSSRTLPMSVENTGFLLDRLGQDCHPLQFIRELTQNSWEAVVRTGSPGTIIWEEDKSMAKHGLHKLSITDNGDGMNEHEIKLFINKLSSSSSLQSMVGNYGVGAKITAAYNNPEGVIYQSWKRGGKGVMINLWKDPLTGEYGLKQFVRSGKYSFTEILADTEKPAAVKTNGTKVTLQGKSYDDNTCNPPMAGLPKFWVSKYLNERYFNIPDDINISVQEDTRYRTIKGMGAFLTSESEASGDVKIPGAVIHWWILKPSKDRNSSGRHVETGHIAALHHNEIYEMKTGRSRNSFMQDFGIVFEINRVVLYVEPTCEVTTNTARTTLLINNQSIPWADFAHEFKKVIPEELIRLQEESINKATSQNKDDIIRRLNMIKDLLFLSGYRRTKSGIVKASGGGASTSGEGGEDDGSTGKWPGGGGPNPPASNPNGGRRAEDLYDVDPNGESAKPNPTLNYPTVRWLTSENGTRSRGHLEDRAAGYSAANNELLINEDFRGFRDAVNLCLGNRSESRNIALPVVTNAIKNWYEQSLTESIIAIRSVEGSELWSDRDLEAALSEEALTLVALQRYHVVASANRQIGATLGAQKAE